MSAKEKGKFEDMAKQDKVRLREGDEKLHSTKRREEKEV